MIFSQFANFLIENIGLLQFILSLFSMYTLYDYCQLILIIHNFDKFRYVLFLIYVEWIRKFDGILIIVSLILSILVSSLKQLAYGLEIEEFHLIFITNLHGNCIDIFLYYLKQLRQPTFAIHKSPLNYIGFRRGKTLFLIFNF